jgi:two-component system, response regulator FlrC
MLLVQHFCRVHAAGRGPFRITPQAIARLEQSPWPGNVRQVENVVLRAVVMATQDDLDVGDFFPEDSSAEASTTQARGEAARSWHGGTIDAAERILIEEALRSTGGNRTQAALLVGISVRTMRNKLRAYREGGAGKNLPTGS